jgi:hypothetical protein
MAVCRRWAQRRDAVELVLLAEEAQDSAGWSGCARCNDAAMALPPQLLAHCLERRPVAAAWSRLSKTNGEKALSGREVGDTVNLDLPPPQLAWHLAVRWDREFGQGPVPLGQAVSSLSAK